MRLRATSPRSRAAYAYALLVPLIRKSSHFSAPESARHNSAASKIWIVSTG